jgi:hypothetical protein
MNILITGLMIGMLGGFIGYGLRRWYLDLQASREWAARWPDLAHLDKASCDPDSGIWRILAPYGYGAWSLYAPGAAPDERGYLSGAPFARLPVTETASDDDEGIERLPQWGRSWIEQAAGGTVTFLLVGWSAPYGELGSRELTGYARVNPKEH